MSEIAKLQEKLAAIPELDTLVSLALDMRWSWNHSSDALWEKIDSELWGLTRNPWVVLQSTSSTRLKSLLEDAEFRSELERLKTKQAEARQSVTWFQTAHPKAKLTSVAYFSMEFGLSEALPIYSGGLGNVAGDQLKAASDLGVPVVGVGLLYQQGYFRQIIDADGSQRAAYPFNDPSQLPIMPLRESSGEWLRIRVRLPGYSLWIRTWEVTVGNVRLLLLDSNDPANPPAYRGITSELYGGGTELRLQQEMILGIIGYRMLDALGIRPEVCHLNEGHAGFAVLERARLFMQETGLSFQEALLATRAGNVFTTHTPVAAGIDRFPAELIKHYLAEYAAQELHIDIADLLTLGRFHAEDTNEPFNMACLGIHGCGAVNGVSVLHAEVSRRMFADLFPRWPTPEVPVSCVTNGVHVPSWDSGEADELWTNACGSERWRNDLGGMTQQLRAVLDELLWEMRCSNREHLIDFVRARNLRQVASIDKNQEAAAGASAIFDPNALTIGFARRFATYKRPNLLLRDPERLARILNNTDHPVQLVVAGKAHPADHEGQAMIREWVLFARREDVRDRVVFLSDYDMMVAEQLVQGVDLWINTPRRPWEACGTSGMKVLVNGGLNLSSLDGWWAEAYDPALGWKIGDHHGYDSDNVQDAAEADELYAVLENEVIPSFYERNSAGIPEAWVARMRESMARLTGQYSANRSVRDYTEQFYLPAAATFLRRSAKRGKLASHILQSKTELRAHRDEIRFLETSVTEEEGRIRFCTQVQLGTISPEHIRVELVADNPDGNLTVLEMRRTAEPAEAPSSFVYEAEVTASRPAGDYTARLTARFDTVTVPLEEEFVLWQR